MRCLRWFKIEKSPSFAFCHRYFTWNKNYYNVALWTMCRKSFWLGISIDIALKQHIFISNCLFYFSFSKNIISALENFRSQFQGTIVPIVISHLKRTFQIYIKTKVGGLDQNSLASILKHFDFGKELNLKHQNGT